MLQEAGFEEHFTPRELIWLHAGDPELLFLDEPTTGLDPSARRRAWDLVRSIRSLGATVLRTRHYLDEAEHLADRVIVIDHGKIVAEGTPEELADSSGLGTVISFRLPGKVPAADLPDIGEDLRVDGAAVQVRTRSATADVSALATWALGRGVELESLALSRPSLEDVYLDLVDTADDEAKDES